MSLGRRLLLRASRSRWLAQQLRRRAFFRRAVRRFLPGEDLGAALDAAAEFARAGLGSVLTQLGEQVSNRAEAVAVRGEHTNVGVCLQAYLRRTPQDLARLLPLGPAIRLVKGAYNEPGQVAFSSKREVDRGYATLADQLLQEAARGRARPVFGTHD